MNNYYLFHVSILFAATIMCFSLIIFLINKKFKEKTKLIRRRIFQFMILTLIFLLNIIFGVVNLLDPIKQEIYEIIAPTIVFFGVSFLLFIIRCCWEKFSKLMLFLMVFFAFVLSMGMLKLQIGNIDPMILVLIGTLAGVVLLPLFVINFLACIPIGKKKKKINYSKNTKKKNILNALIVLMLLIVIAFSSLTLNPNRAITDDLVIYSWYDYFTDDSIESFEEEFGVNVTVYNFGKEPVMEMNISNNPGMFDLVIMPDEYVKKFRLEGKLEKIDKKYIPRMNNIGKDFLDKNYDPENIYSIPYLWGTTGILMNKKYIKENDTWGIFFNSKYEGKMIILNTPSDLISIASSYLGYGPVPTEVSQLLRVEQFLNFQKSLSFLGSEVNVLFYDYDGNSTWNDFITGDIWASQFYSGDAIVFMENNKNLTYVLPKEGAVKWIDNFVILKNSKNKRTAEAFINHILDPIRSAEISNMTKFATSNTEAMKYIDTELLESEAFLPSEESFDQLVYISDFETMDEMEKLKAKLWRELNEI